MHTESSWILIEIKYFLASSWLRLAFITCQIRSISSVLDCTCSRRVVSRAVATDRC